MNQAAYDALLVEYAAVKAYLQECRSSRGESYLIDARRAMIRAHAAASEALAADKLAALRKDWETGEYECTWEDFCRHWTETPMSQTLSTADLQPAKPSKPVRANALPPGDPRRPY